jgi:hypothetical protein
VLSAKHARFIRFFFCKTIPALLYKNELFLKLYPTNYYLLPEEEPPDEEPDDDPDEEPPDDDPEETDDDPEE